MGLRLLGGAYYVVRTAQGKAVPNPITWLCWFITPSIAAAAQWNAGVGLQALMTLTLALGPLAIFITSMIKGHNAAQFTRFNIACGLLALAGIVLWQLTSNPVLAILFCILADIFGGIPTVVKAYKDPKSEPILPYLMTTSALIITVLTIKSWTIEEAVFPIYIFCINALILTLAGSKIGQRRALRRGSA